MLTALLIFIPLIASVVTLVFKPTLTKYLAFITSLVLFVITLIVICHFDKASIDSQFGVDVPWIASLGINFSVGIDGISLLLVLLTTLITPFIILSASSDSTKSSSYYSLILLMQSALIGVFTARDGFLFYIFWEIALIPIYFICLVWGGENRGRITLKFFIYTLTGSLFMLVALIFLYFKTPTHTFALQALYDAGRSLDLSQQTYLFTALFLAFAIKMPVFPFHTWQPDTYTVAPTQGTMLLSAIMLKMGIYGVIRWLIPIVPLAVTHWGFVAVGFSVIGIVYASCIAIVQKDFKRLIAYSSIAHVGLISAGIFTLSVTGVQGAMIQMVSHGIVVFGLFYIVDIVYARAKTREFSELAGIRNVAPQLATVFVVIMLGSVALPLTSGFVGEFLLIQSLVQYHIWIGAVAGMTIILGAVYMLKTFQKTMSGETNSVTALLTDLTLHEKLILYPIVVLIVVIGIYPKPLLEISEAAVTNLLTLYSSVK